MFENTQYPTRLRRVIRRSGFPGWFIDGWKGVERNPLVERKTIDGAAVFVWLDRPELVGEEVARFVSSLAER